MPDQLLVLTHGTKIEDFKFSDNIQQSLPWNLSNQLSVLMMELILTRIFSVKLYYHYAFVVISLALLGSGASGVYIYLFPNFLSAKGWEDIFAFSLFVLQSPPSPLILELDFQLLFSPWVAGHILLPYSIPAIPFFLGASVFPWP